MNRFLRVHLWSILLALTWGTYFTLLFARILWITPDGAIMAGHENVWSDWSLHIAFTTLFAEKSPDLWFAYHPMYADGKLNYTFLTNWISSLFLRAGFSLPQSLIFPSIAFAWGLLFGLHRLFARLLGSPARSYLAITLFFTSGGLGFLQFFSDWWKYPTWERFIYPVKEYGRLDSYGWYSSNWITGILVPQRSSLIGVTLAIWSLVLLIEFLEKHPKTGEIKIHFTLLLAGVFAGLLPIAHMHSFIFLVGAAGLICVLHAQRWRELLCFVLSAGTLSSLLYFNFMHGAIENPRFMSVHVGYTAHSLTEWIWFWGMVWGVMLPLGAFGVFKNWAHLSKNAKAFYIACFSIFAVANVVQFQPVQWDNSKLFMWAYFGISCCAATVISNLWNLKQDHYRSFLQAGACILLTLASLTGFVEISRLQQISKHSYPILTAENARLGDKIRVSTKPLDRFLTDKTHNHWVMVRGARPILLGFTPWVWNFGFNYFQTEKDVQSIYQGSEQALELLKKHQIQYVVIGPGEIQNLKANQTFFNDHFPIAFSNSQYSVYQVNEIKK